MTTKSLKKQKLRNNEYYDIQDVFDALYSESLNGKKFNNLMEIITSEDNISLAYRNINKINYLTSITLHNRLKNVISDQPSLSEAYKKFYGKYKGKIRTVSNVSIFPINGISTVPPMNFTQEICNYTKVGRELVHKKLDNNYHHLIRYLLNNGTSNESTELRDNKISLMIAQKGNCGITKRPLSMFNMECHHMLPRFLGGTDSYKNLIWICTDAHRLIHATKEDTITNYLQKLKLDKKSLEKLNSLREKVGNLAI